MYSKRRVIAGRSVVDESMLTRESLPVYKERDLTVSAGTVEWDGPLKLEATTAGSMSTISKIVRMMACCSFLDIGCPR
ncbi:hypothetical protein AQUCO_11100012v1 [Aquilegia coerulea]|uniref:P-type ATPase A domain-containing protein n=1 Tax=Aquilegia coerulea TaxID=218851 RepID=A0A2G5C2P5_AQUCA|nr:hypothetical protein AQUCO_11100012v1 [Aquilegia coerulea]